MLISHKKRGKSHKTIAIVSYSDNVVFRRAENGLMHTLIYNPDVSFDYITIKRQTEQELYDRVYNLVERHDFDLIYTIGTRATRVSQAVTQDQKRFFPIFFGGVANPAQEGFVHHDEFPGSNITGVSAIPRDYNEQFKHLLELLKHATNTFDTIFIPYDIETLPEKDSKQHTSINELASERGINVIRIPFKNFSSLKNEIDSQLTKSSLIYTLRDGATTDNIGEIAQYCAERKTPIFSSDHESVKQGAALGFGDNEYVVGEVIGRRSLPLLLEKKKPNTFPVSVLPWNGKFLINHEAAEKQGLSLKKSSRYFLSNKGVLNMFRQAIN